MLNAVRNYLLGVVQSLTKPGGGRLPSLDGLRAISIGMVVLSHLIGTRNFPLAEEGRMEEMGYLGVRVFFIISGYLITTLLLKELEKTGTISIKEFYLRRFFRIFPAYYALIAVLAVAAAVGWITFRPWDLTCALTYTMNYHADHGWNLAHAWSLAVEEQFYILWPATLFFAGRRRAFQIAAGIVAIAPLIRIGMWYLVPSHRPLIGHDFPTVADTLAIGCLLAGLKGRLSGVPRYLAFLRSPYFVAVPVMALLLNLVDRPRIQLLVGNTIINLAVALCIDRCVRYPSGITGRVLNARPMIAVGVLSYSIYLWQQPFLNRTSVAFVNSFPVNFLLMALLALGSYSFVERPFLDLRSVLKRRKSRVAVVA